MTPAKGVWWVPKRNTRRLAPVLPPDEDFKVVVSLRDEDKREKWLLSFTNGKGRKSYDPVSSSGGS